MVEAPERPGLDDGQTLVRVDAFALTANTMTYATSSEAYGFWELFPSDEAGMGRLPAWGTGTVVASRSLTAVAGTVLFGFFPMASHLVVTPAPTRTGVRDAAGHRRGVHPAYNRYRDVTGWAEEDLVREMLLRPVHLLAFVVAEHLREHGVWGATDVIVTSASSKAGAGLAHALRHHGLRRTGVTATGRTGLVGGWGLFERVVSYEEAGDLATAGKAVVIDVAGDEVVLSRIVDGLGGGAAGVLRVGTTHGGGSGDGELFFAPSHIERLVGLWGAASFEERFAAELDAFARVSARWLRTRLQVGQAGAAAAYRELAAGALRGDEMTVVRPHGPAANAARRVTAGG